MKDLDNITVEKMERPDKEKPIKVGSQFRKNGIVYKISGFINCTPKNKECFWDYTLSYKDKKKQDAEVHVNSNVLFEYFEKL